MQKRKNSAKLKIIKFIKVILIFVALVYPLLILATHGFNLYYDKTFHSMDILQSVYAYKLNSLVFSVFVVSCCAFAIRFFCKIDSKIKEIIFMSGLLFYLIPYQIIFFVKCIEKLKYFLSIVEDFSKLEWVPYVYALTDLVLLPISALFMSIWIYIIFAINKNTSLKITLATFLIYLLEIVMVKFDYPISTRVCIVWTPALLLWLATAADITFEGFGYKLVEKSLNVVKSKFYKNRDSKKQA